jgi:hypothetical protein
MIRGRHRLYLMMALYRVIQKSLCTTEQVFKVLSCSKIPVYTHALGGAREFCVSHDCMIFTTTFLEPVVQCCNRQCVHHEKYIFLTGAQGLLNCPVLLNTELNYKQLTKCTYLKRLMLPTQTERSWVV